MKILKMKIGTIRYQTTDKNATKNEKKMWHIINTNYVNYCGTMTYVVKSKVGKIEKDSEQLCAKEAKNRSAISAQSFPLMKFSHLPPSCQNKGLWVGCEWNYKDFIFLPRQN